ncbi:hypothetical protein [Pelobacter seleniigenes]|uniref:hypothetical protein n=1 Tax=Pelobacter seleniigenes TaxID=407188 RepID=UPI0012B977F0|nr:hypothetical protein [Pelobacter seleniigenes]
MLKLVSMIQRREMSASCTEKKAGPLREKINSQFVFALVWDRHPKDNPWFLIKNHCFMKEVNPLESYSLLY